jgi:hypothetical protein
MIGVTMTYDLTDEVNLIGSLNFEGNIIPVEWLNKIRLPNNKPDLISIFLLSDIIYWYRPTTVRDEVSGKVVGYRKKFKADLLQKGYSDLEDLFGLTKDQIKRSLRRLEELNLIKRIFRNINSNGTSLANVMFIQIFPSNIAKITEKKFISDIKTNLSVQISTGVRANIHTPPCTNPHTYTKTTTEITTKNSLSNKSNSISKEPKLDSLNSNVKYEREKEMINIWDKIIREGDRPSVHNQTRLTALKKVLKESFEGNLENWKTYCLNIKNSNFLMGGGANKWKSDLTWAIRQDNLIRVLEGYYHQKEGKRLDVNISEDLQEDNEIKSNDPIWNSVKELLKRKKGEATYKSWFKKLQIEGYEQDKALLIAPSKFIKDWILNNFKDDIINSFEQTKSNIKDIKIFVKNDAEVLV